MDKSTNNVERAIHGAFDYGELERLGLHPREVLDFSANANPYGTSEWQQLLLALQEIL